MSKPSVGTVRILQNADHQPQWHGKFTLADKSRSKWEPLDPKIPAIDTPENRAAAKAYAASVAPRIRKRSAGQPGIETVAEYAKRWLGDREGRISAVRDDRTRITLHVLPLLGPIDVATFTRDDVERLRDALDVKITTGDLSWKTVACVWTLVTSMCGDMVTAKKRELRTRDDNPCRDVQPPERGARKAKQYLYPSEFLKFVSCDDVPLRWRRAVALAVCTFARDGELRALEWGAGDIDLEHGVLSITRARNARSGKVESTKSEETRRFALEPALLPLLQAMHDEVDGKGHLLRWHELHMARGLRRWLKVAKVDRDELHNGSATRKPMTWHDLRATGLTWMAVRGLDPLKIKQRAGHASFSTTELYIRQAEAVREGFGEPFPALPEALVRIAPKSPGAIAVPLSIGNPALFGAGHESRTRDLRLGKPTLYQLS